MSNYIKQFNDACCKNKFDFSIGDTVCVNSTVTDGTRKRVQSYEGIVIARRNRGLHSSATVRKTAHGVSVERVFQLHSPLLVSIQCIKRGSVRKAKIYWLRERTGRAARIREKI